MTTDDVIKELENTAVKVATNDVVSYLVANVWVGFGWIGLNPLMGYLVGIVASILMQKLDWVSYMLMENWEVTNEGKSFEKTALDLSKALDGGNADEIAKAQAAKEDAFRKLIGMGSN